MPILSPDADRMPAFRCPSTEPTESKLTTRSAYVKASHMSPGVLFVFCLLGASLGLLVWWFFVRRRDGGFIWKRSDWEDYKSSVLRRPDRPEDAITIFSDGSARRGGSSTGTRTVVLGELDTSITKSEVYREKPWGPRELRKKDGKGGARKMIGSVFGGGEGSKWGKGEGSVWARLRGGDRHRGDVDTVVQREKELANEYEGETDAGESFVSSQAPAPPLTGFLRTETTIRHPRRDASYSIGDDRASQPVCRGRSIGTILSSDSETESATDTDSDSGSDVDESTVGMGKGTKVYHHPIAARHQAFWTSTKPLEKNGGGAAGSYTGSSGVGKSNAKGYRRGSNGSLSSVGSMASSNGGH